MDMAIEMVTAVTPIAADTASVATLEQMQRSKN
jgi:hypothetical protein